MTRPCECGLGLRPRRLSRFLMEPVDGAPGFCSGSLTLGAAGSRPTKSLPTASRPAMAGYKGQENQALRPLARRLLDENPPQDRPRRRSARFPPDRWRSERHHSIRDLPRSWPGHHAARGDHDKGYDSRTNREAARARGLRRSSHTARPPRSGGASSQRSSTSCGRGSSKRSQAETLPQSVVVLVGSVLPWAVTIAEIHLNVSVNLQPYVLSHLTP